MARIEELKIKFIEWSGFPLEGNNYDDIMAEIQTRSWDLQNEVNQQAKILENMTNEIFPDDNF